MGGSISRFLRDMRFLWRMISALQSVRKIGKQCNSTSSSSSSWNIISFWEDTLQKYRTKKALRFGQKTMTFDELNRTSNQFANAALKLGWKGGDTIGLYMSNCIEYIAILIGMAKIGITCSLLNTNVKGESLAHCMKECNVTQLICTVDHIESIQSVVVSQNNPINNVFCVATNENYALPSFGKLFDYKTSDEKEPSANHRANVSAMDPYIHIFTSGTTGLPKAAKINHLRFYASSLIFVKLLQIRQNDVIYCPLPFYHSSAIVLGLVMSWHTGCEFVFREKFSTSEFWKDCVSYNVTIVQYIGELCRYLVNAPPVVEEKAHCVRMAIGNGLRADVWERFQSRFRVEQIAEFYVATEGNFGFVNTENKVGAVGFLSPIIQKKHPGKIIRYNYETGEPYRDVKGRCVLCKVGEVGELVGVIETKDVTRRFDGYTNQSATEKKIIRNVFKENDSYFRSGDLLWMDKEGYLYFHDRIGDTYRWKGENISTTEVESIIATSLLESIEECVVYGVSIPGYEGRAGMLLIKPAAAAAAAAGGGGGEDFDLVNLFSVIQEKVPQYAQPYFVRICSEAENVDMTGTYKYRKTALVEEGFDPSKVSMKGARLFFRGKEAFVTLDDTLFQRITSGEIRL